MRKFVIFIVSTTAMLAGFYLSAKHFAEPLPEANQAAMPAPSMSSTSGVGASSSLTGVQRPGFSLESHSGGEISIDDYSGKTILINFWATWCTPCRQEMPMLMDLQREHKASGLQVVGIALDDPQSVKNFVQTYGISYPILVGGQDTFDVSTAYGNKEGVLPYSVLIDKSGIVRWQYAGKLHEEDISLQLSDLL